MFWRRKPWPTWDPADLEVGMKGVCRRAMDDDQETEWWREVRYRSLRYGELKNVPSRSMELVSRERVEDNDRLMLNEDGLRVVSFPKVGSKKLVLKSRVRSGEVELGVKLVRMVLSLDGANSVAVVSSNSGYSNDQQSSVSFSVGSWLAAEFPTWSAIAAFWRRASTRLPSTSWSQTESSPKKAESNIETGSFETIDSFGVLRAFLS